ncbi:BZ3500_MvSof-1268-A1-R1_Chr12-3g04048 [Microbotryum saponariae]|uniref:BZ3500_MvSof-1268-A1-R1_Chr12-3g04048 protein n=1 Tax=Microbotryum saponariae TaxID=289078 RepID=A0A2X0N5Z1_9BASI|nr:BZ3500_MvSof-1268-A1-R1_Chr12-3g04048 [Microbotryum saponariae]SDA02602.1 BZ3501_MvSof-1269-A2-R1_Chr12-3g03703 [Microbotryum saponariae]
MPPHQVFIIVRPPPSKGVDMRNLQIQLVNTTRTNTAHPSQAKAGAPTPPPHALGKETEGHLGTDEGVGSEGRGQGSGGSSAHPRPWITSGTASTSTLGAKSFDAVAGATIDSHDGPIESGPNEIDPSSPHLTAPSTAPRPRHPGSTEMIRSTSWQSDKSSSSAISTKSSLSSSIRSTGTGYSIGGSSVGPKGSGGGGGSGRDRRGRGSKRRVTPLYNLTFHALLQTVVTDAGTDEKIAKFSKKGTIEMMDFAFFEPLDLRAPPTISTSSTSLSTVTSPLALMRSRVAEQSTNGGQSPGGLLSKLKKLGMGKAAMKGNGGGSTGGMTASTSSGRLSINEPRPSLALPDQNITVVSPPRKLARGHAFTLTKFLRNDLVEARHLIGMNVRFEWKRMEKKRSTGTRNQSRFKSPRKEGSDRTVRKDEEGGLEVSLEEKGSRRASEGEGLGSDVSIGSERTSGELDRAAMGLEGTRLSSAGSADEALAEQGDDEDMEEEEDSDLEDSDRPWSCTLYITQTNAPQSPSTSSSEPWSLPLAHLIPAPYHPRLVANLSFSPTLSDVRLGNGAGISEEELKDVVSVTALWVVAKDGLGGRAGGGGGRLKVVNGKGKGRKGSFGGG